MTPESQAKSWKADYALCSPPAIRQPPLPVLTGRTPTEDAQRFEWTVTELEYEFGTEEERARVQGRHGRTVAETSHYLVYFDIHSEFMIMLMGKT